MHSIQELISHLKEARVLKSRNIENALRAVDRKRFVPAGMENMAYFDAALPIGEGQTISQPYTVIFMLELLELQDGQKILDVGSGSGWTTALLSVLAGKNGEVIGVEVIPSLVETGRRNIKKLRVNANIYFAGDIDGKDAYFDRILISAAGNKVPEKILRQLKPGGIMVLPIVESIWKVKKTAEGKLEKAEYPGFAFVPLVE